MQMDTRRLVLRAALQKLLEGQDIRENVQLCHENMEELYAETDEIIRIRRRREDSGWTKTALETVTLNRLGNFLVKSKLAKTVRTIRFTEGTTTLEFRFEKPTRTIEEEMNIATRTPDISHEEILEHLVASIDPALSKAIDPLRKVMAKEPTTALSHYELKSVSRIVPKLGIVGFLGLTLKTVIYNGTRET